MTESCTPGGKATLVDLVHLSPLTDPQHHRTHIHTHLRPECMFSDVVLSVKYNSLLISVKWFLRFEWLLCTVCTAQSFFFFFFIQREICQAVDKMPNSSDWVSPVCLCLIFTLSAHLVGHSDSHSRNVPTLVKDISGVGQVACGSSHTIAVAQDGRIVWSFGGGDNGNISYSPRFAMHKRF